MQTEISPSSLTSSLLHTFLLKVLKISYCFQEVLSTQIMMQKFIINLAETEALISEFIIFCFYTNNNIPATHIYC